MKSRVEDYLNLPYTTYVVPDVTTDGQPCYLAHHPELEGCMSHGSTIEEALRNLGEATELYVRTLLSKRIEVPLPQGIAEVRGCVPERILFSFSVAGQMAPTGAAVYESLPATPPLFAPAV